MSPVLLLPAGLAALAALALPLLIHLARRTEQRTTDFAALRWLRQKSKPRRLPRLDERLLLAARLLLLALLALWLARPAVLGAADRTPWFAVAPGVDPAEARPAAPRGVQARWLAPGFPDLRTSPAPAPGASVSFASLLRQLDAELPSGARLTVLVPQRLQGADAERPRLSRRVDWRVASGSSPPAAPAPPPAAPRLQVRYATAGDPGLRYVRAAAQAWTLPGAPADLAEAATSQAPTSGGDLVWLAPGPLPASVADWVERGGTALVAAETPVDRPPSTTVVWRDALGRPLVEAAPLGRGRLLRFTRSLTPAAMPQLLEPDFPDRLRALLVPTPPAPARVLAQDYAPLPGGASYPQPARDLRPWLTLLIGAVLLGERWLATRRTRAVAP